MEDDMNENVKEYIDKFPDEVKELYNQLRNIIYDNVSQEVKEELCDESIIYCVGDNFVKLSPCKDYINIEAQAISLYKKELKDYIINSKGMLQIYLNQTFPVNALSQVFALTLDKGMFFLNSKKMYDKARTYDRNEIARYLRNSKIFEVERSAARQGTDKYSSGGRLHNKYDLSDWKWVCVKRNNVHFFISLQSFERDPKTGNLHVLMDRIGIYAYTGDYSPIDAQTKMMVTEIELPMDKEKLKKLEEILIDLSECKIYRVQAELEKIRLKHNLIK